MSDSRRTIACVAISGVALIVALIMACGLAFDAWRTARNAPAATAQHAELERQARADRAAAQAFAETAKQSAAATVAREIIQRRAAITGLIAAAGFLVAVQRLPKRQRRRTVATSQLPCAHEGRGRGRPGSPAPTPRRLELTAIERIVNDIGKRRDDAISLLNAVEDEYGYLPMAALQRLTELADVDAAQLCGVASFYDRFRTNPRGRHVVRVCHGTACHVAGSPRLTEQLRRDLNVPPGADTDPTGLATIEEVACLGCCTLAPVVELDRRLNGKVSVEAVREMLYRLREARNNGHPKDGAPATRAPAIALATNGESTSPIEICIGVGSCCLAGGSGDIIAATEREIARRRLNARVKRVGCVGACASTPLITIHAEGQPPRVIAHATCDDARHLVRALDRESKRTRRRFGAHRPVEILDRGRQEIDHFLAPQWRIVTEHSGRLTPTDLDEYRRCDGIAALARCLDDMTPEDVIEAVARSGLRGRGGAGFPTHAKWRVARNAVGGPKLVICNGDEGDPGAYMDRMVMESYPYRVLEGMLIAAYAVGAAEGILYIRHEYPLAVERIRIAIGAMQAAGLLGERILGSEFSFQARVVEGAGAFVCGEETALIQSLMGERGSPRPRPPYPAECGVHGRPTVVNNVETLANLPWIIRRGPEAYAKIGTPDSRGTKVFSLSGKVCRAGLIEAPMGMTLREIVDQIGGGVAGGKRLKAIQIGGPSGGCIPARLADTPVDFEQLKAVGAIMGSGGLVVLDENDCMVDLARYFLRFTQRESCGRCTFCRIGTKRLLEILERICEGRGHRGDLDEIERVAAMTSAGSLCGLGKTAPNPVVTTLRYFREEYEAHLAGRCPAGRCAALIEYRVTPECTGCTICAQRCPEGAIPFTPYEVHVIDSAACTRCDICRQCCPEGAIAVVSPIGVADGPRVHR
jgi:NADH:ubiquinone oxidoreductase subunit F (NADH-binding)/NADH:ubiquinone oxidoreductase subunit E/Pyruvate/2-oxoacid:ferredoxin oxidoreductase delta subunit